VRDPSLPASEHDQLLVRHDRSLCACERSHRIIRVGHKATLGPNREKLQGDAYI
jgi:hypothetical protein